MADRYEVLPLDEGLSILTIEDPHADNCPLNCVAHKHVRTEHTAGEFDAAHLIKGTNIDVLVQAGMIRKVEPKQDDGPAAGKAKKDG